MKFCFQQRKCAHIYTISTFQETAKFWRHIYHKGDERGWSVEELERIAVIFKLFKDVGIIFPDYKNAWLSGVENPAHER